MTEIHLVGAMIVNKKYWDAGFILKMHVRDFSIQPYDGPTYGWKCKNKFCPEFRYTLVEKGRLHVNSKP